MFVYLISEESKLDKDAMENNKYLAKILELRNKYKMSLLLLLTHFDNYCDKIKKETNDWKNICKETIIDNKNNLLKYINGTIEEKYKSDFKMGDDDILHIVLVEQNKNQMTHEEKFNNLPKELKEQYKHLDEGIKRIVTDAYYKGKEDEKNEVNDFIRKEMNILGQKELIEIIKGKFPSQYHDALNVIE